MNKIYLSGPIQHSVDRGKGWRQRIKKVDGFEWVDPLEKYEDAADESDEWSNTKIVEEDLSLIDDSDAVLVHWEEVPTCGTPMELRYAHESLTPIVGQTTVPFERLSPWFTYHVDVIEPTFEDACFALDDVLKAR
jgi:nucleoside 2-deoxyribosyltransferase